jgi:acyl CoA:acetate/3-ketoacid CoA transferase
LLSLVPVLLASALPPDVVLMHTSAPAGGTVSPGTEVNVLPAAIEAARARGGLVIAQVAHPRVRGELREAGRALGFRV